MMMMMMMRVMLMMMPMMWFFKSDFGLSWPGLHMRNYSSSDGLLCFCCDRRESTRWRPCETFWPFQEWKKCMDCCANVLAFDGWSGRLYDDRCGTNHFFSGIKSDMISMMQQYVRTDSLAPPQEEHAKNKTIGFLSASLGTAAATSPLPFDSYASESLGINQRHSIDRTVFLCIDTWFTWPGMASRHEAGHKSWLSVALLSTRKVVAAAFGNVVACDSCEAFLGKRASACAYCGLSTCCVAPVGKFMIMIM